MERVRRLHKFFKSLDFVGENERGGRLTPTRFTTEFAENEGNGLDAQVTLKIDHHHIGAVALDRELFPENYDPSRETTPRTDADNKRKLAEKIRELGVHDAEISSINMQKMTDHRYAYGKVFTIKGITGSNEAEQKAVAELVEKLANYQALEKKLLPSQNAEQSHEDAELEKEKFNLESRIRILKGKLAKAIGERQDGS